MLEVHHLVDRAIVHFVRLGALGRNACIDELYSQEITELDSPWMEHMRYTASPSLLPMR